VISQVTLSKILKAAYSAAMAFLGALATVLGDNVTLGQLTAGQWVTIAAFTLGAAGGTFGLAGWQGPNIGDSGPKGTGG
jgi:threonine/homoserine efflux transporter RhtA